MVCTGRGSGPITCCIKGDRQDKIHEYWGPKRDPLQVSSCLSKMAIHSGENTVAVVFANKCLSSLWPNGLKTHVFKCMLLTWAQTNLTPTCTPTPLPLCPVSKPLWPFSLFSPPPPPPSLPLPEGDVVFRPSASRFPGPVLSLWMAPSMLCPAVIEHYEVFHASVH